MLEKYKKLAHDASLNGDRVQTEYYLQFADHYFRVVADSRTGREDQRPRRENERDGDRDQSFDDGEGFDERDEQPAAGPRSTPARRDRDEHDDAPSDEGERAVEGEAVDTAEDNPFVREPNGRRPRSRERAAPVAKPAVADHDSGFDAGILPPSIAREEDPQPRPKRARTRRARPAEDNGEEAVEAVS